PLLRGESAYRRARGGRRFDPGLRFCAVFGRYAVVDRHDGHEEFRRCVPQAREEVRRTICAEQVAARSRRERRGLLRPLCPGEEERGCLIVSRCSIIFELNCLAFCCRVGALRGDPGLPILAPGCTIW